MAKWCYVCVLAAIVIYMDYSSTAVGPWAIRREEGRFVEFIKIEDSRLLIELLHVLKKGAYQR